ncbi:CP2 transcription factor-domain-containing protein [Hypoxylon trugodes]|uniref:CP2 transcription factor-domain-containing protein n=1 Tax=Hypoxylon trugodes TaxID=326681 RepID=UPI00219466EE|nr:CP2 transcription factor-domain-containing protein [Hypoxylon trugodes]KAI1385593.1 CP2 transcription factor-domain-containing protein [Hypoxylon trugodes]
MFRQRTSSQKPGDELLANFRQQFPEITAVASSSASGAPAQTTVTADNSVLVPPGPEHVSHDVFRDQDPTPRASGAEWRFTPSLLDPNSFSFSTFANQPPGYYTPTPGGTNTLYHPQAGDLHTPSMGLGMGLGTPLSLPTTEGAIQAGPAMMDLTQFHQGIPPPHQFPQPFNPFIQPTPPQPTFAPSSFVHQDTGYETMDHDGSPLDSDSHEEHIGSMDATFHSQSPPNMMGFQHRHFGGAMAHMLPASANKFRFQSTLNAPTAMIKHADEIPVTYLNKGQAYSLSVVDTAATMPIVPGTKYRTFVRISFEDDQQRQKPGVCWSLWKEGRGTNEAHQRGGKLQAVEYVEAGQPAEGDDKRTRIELETASFDGFSVVWTPGTNGAAECSVAVRFNFLSTDFSHSKGVKGIPVRLCAKTTALSSTDSSPLSDPAFEICYCKVKLFRDHGAERKLSNDVAHVKKTIDKLKQQISQAESGAKDFGKRKRGGGSHTKGQDHSRPGKASKHKRTWSMSSASSAGGGGRPSLEDDLHFKLQTLQDMFTSTRPVSILYLRGDDLDDPDLHPVSLPGEPTDLTKVEPKDTAAWQIRSARSSVAGSSLVSPSPSSMSLHSQSANPSQWNDFRGGSGEPSGSRRPSDMPIKVPKTDDDGNLSGWIEALGVDHTYKPPTERPIKPIACFYVVRRHPSEPERRELHRAVYLTERTIAEFVTRASAKWAIDPSAVVRVIRVLDNGMEIQVDDDVIRALPEGKDMALEVVEVDRSIPQPKREWEMMTVDASETDRESAHSVFRTTTGYELRIKF